MEKYLVNTIYLEIDRDLRYAEIVENFVDNTLRVPDVARKDGWRETPVKPGFPADEIHRFNYFAGFRGGG